MHRIAGRSLLPASINETRMNVDEPPKLFGGRFLVAQQIADEIRLFSAELVTMTAAKPRDRSPIAAVVVERNQRRRIHQGSLDDVRKLMNIHPPGGDRSIERHRGAGHFSGLI